MKQTDVASNKTILLRGVIRNLQVKKTTAQFFFTAADQNKLGATGVMAAAMGLSGIAAGMASASLNEAHETVTQMSFELNGEKIEALVWTCPYKNGQVVEVVAERADYGYRAFSVADPTDRTIAMYPHAASGRIAHYSTVFTWLSKLYAGIVIFGFLFLGFFARLTDEFTTWRSFGSIFFPGIGLILIISSVIGIRIAAKYMPFVCIAEGVFRAMGWNDVEHINLRKQTLKNKKLGDDPYLGVYYFRY